MTYLTAALVDVVTLAVCVPLLVKYGRLAHSHPASIYLLFHLFVFTARNLALLAGAPPLFTDLAYSSIEPVLEGEIARAILVADGALFLMMVAWIRASVDDVRLAARATLVPRGTSLHVPTVQRVAFVALPLGLLGLLAFARLPGVDNSSSYESLGVWSRSALPLIVQSWAGLALLGLIYVHGPKPRLLVPLSMYLAVMAYQGFHRYRVVLPIVFLVQLVLDRQDRRWPNRGAMVAIVLLLVAFYPLKQVGQLFQEGATVQSVFDASRSTLDAALRGQNADQVILDEFASALTLVDQGDHLYWGEPYLAAVTIAVPRAWWPDKPSPADYLASLSRPWRPMAEAGMAITLLGELYANFGWWGITIIPPLIAYLLARFYFSAYRLPYLSLRRFSYLVIATTLLQVYRDGLVSLPVFLVINMTPLLAILLSHITRRPTRSVRVAVTVRANPSLSVSRKGRE